MTTLSAPIDHTDPINAQILAISEDKIQGFVREPFVEIAEKSGVPLETVIERIRTMLQARTIRRVRQTLIATNLAEGALVAWRVPEEKLNDAFDFMFQQDPFSGHVVVRSTDNQTTGSEYRLWTTLKVPAGISMDRHAELLMRYTGCDKYLLMPANGIFALGVGHVRRKAIEPGDKSEGLAAMIKTGVVSLTDLEWQILVALKREFSIDEIGLTPVESPRRGSRGLARTILRSRRIAPGPQSHRPFLHLSGARQAAANRPARHPLQRPLPLGCAERSREGSRERDRPLRHPHPLLLA